MVSKIRQNRRDRQKKHIPSKLVFDISKNQYTTNPLFKKTKKKPKKEAKDSGFRKD